EICALNTHLFGDNIGPSWQDYARAEDIADTCGASTFDVVGFEEIWDEDLFYGGDGADGIRPRAGFPFGFHGEAHDLDPLNSGLAIMSQHPLSDTDQVSWTECDGSLPTD